MKNKRSKIYSLLLVLVLCLTTVFANTNTSKAAEKEYDNLLEEYGNAVADTAITYDFTVDTNTDVYFYLYAPALVNCDITVYDSVGTYYAGGTIYSSDLVWEESISSYYYDLVCSDMDSGDYTVEIKFDANTDYIFGVDATKIQATISASKATITAGFTKKLTVDNCTGTVKWTTSKKSVATVSSKGVVTGKKAGTATITATVQETGQKLTCKVTVKENAYKETKGSYKDLYYGNCALQVYKASYAKNGDLVLKVRFINYSGYKVSSLKDMKITFKSASGKTIGTYSVKSKSMSVSNQSSKDFTVTIKKSKLKIKKADLRNASYTTSGTYIYYY
ncbi:Ig-like domain-containing protein [Anaerosporobacter faecicola]|uniref:Ig-like domain-containing protein n=1 Tax=Anaerosporobacter faecicola TaxID=2718714 RepID=UPI001A9B71EC|nr:Ig-like domain-containing protein [Anaerosporobacter faecicola]